MRNEKTTDHPVFGLLRYGLSYWRGNVAIPAFDRPFSLIVRAGREGPSQRQSAAMTTLLANTVGIRQQATGPMAALHRESGLSYPAGNGDAGVWTVLRPEDIEVSDESYDRDGRICVALVFGSTLEPDFAPAIATADGHFQAVLSGT